MARKTRGGINWIRAAVVATGIAIVACTNTTAEATPAGVTEVPPVVASATPVPAAIATPTLTAVPSPPAAPIPSPTVSPTPAPTAVVTPITQSQAKDDSVREIPGPYVTSPSTGEPQENRIVFVSLDSQIYVTSPEGDSPVRISPRRNPDNDVTDISGYTWPGWSPDGRSILYSAALSRLKYEDPPYRLLASASDGTTSEEPRLLYESEPGSGLIVPGGPYYSVWSPDSRRVASIVATPTDLQVLVSDTQRSHTAAIALGAPFYLGWSPDSSELLVHKAEQLYRYDEPFTDGSSALVQGGSTAYFAPMYSPNDGRSAFLMDTENGAVLTIMDQSHEKMAQISDIPTVAWFQWSPDGSRIAILKSSPDSDRFETTLSLVYPGEQTGAPTVEAREEELLTGRYTLAMWSPDGSKLLIASSHATLTSLMTWSVLDLDTGEQTDIATFTPSGELLNLHRYYDQYAASHTFWSPDGSSIVLTGSMYDPLRPALQQAVDERVWVVTIDGSAPPRPIADGYLAFRSPG